MADRLTKWIGARAATVEDMGNLANLREAVDRLAAYEDLGAIEELAELQAKSNRAVEVVRCKDCQSAQKGFFCPKQLYCCNHLVASGYVSREDDDYCSYGRRKPNHQRRTTHADNITTLRRRSWIHGVGGAG